MLEGNDASWPALAARTSQVTLGLLVGGVTYRNPALLAKATTTLDVISGGRAILGLGAAWYEAEHIAYGFPFPPLKERFERLEDALRIARAMFTRGAVERQGTHHHTDDVMNYPRPLRGDIPIMVGGSGERKTLRLVAQYADACNLFADLDRARHLLGVLEGHCERVGRDPAEITKTRMGNVFVARTHEAAMAKLERLGAASRGPAAHAGHGRRPGRARGAGARRFRDAGIEGLTVIDSATSTTSRPSRSSARARPGVRLAPACSGRGVRRAGAPLPPRRGGERVRRHLPQPGAAPAQLSFGAMWAGEWAAMVAVGVVAFRDGGAAAVGAVALVRMLPAALMTPFAATLADAFRRERVLLWVGLDPGRDARRRRARARPRRAAAAVYALLVAATIAQTLYRPAHSALLPVAGPSPRS